MVLAAVKWSGFVPLVALAFTMASFWWIYLRRGRLTATESRTYSFALRGPDLFIRFPLAIFNTGAAAIVVEDLRLVAGGHNLEWTTLRRTLRPLEDDFLDYAAPFAIGGRQVGQVFAEFGGKDVPWRPEPGGQYPLRIERRVSGRWKPLLSFAWTAPETDLIHYIVHRNPSAA